MENNRCECEGMEKTTITEGSGWEKPKDGYEVFVNLKGKFLRAAEENSEEEVTFDEIEGDEPRKYVVGSNIPCKGLEAAILQMKKGEKALVKLEPEAAFGSDGLAEKNVPPNARVTYEVELKSWNKVEEVKNTQGAVKVLYLEEGTGYERPKPQDIVFLKYKARLEDGSEVAPQAMDTDEKIRLRVEDVQPVGLRLAVQEMKRGSKTVVTAQPSYAWGAEGSCNPGVPANATVLFDVELCDFHTVEDVCKDGGIQVELFEKPSSAWKKPKIGSTCVVSFTAAVAGADPWDSRVFASVMSQKLTLGELNSDFEWLTDGFERALEHLVAGQEAFVTIKAKYGFGDQGHGEKVKAGDTIEYKVTLEELIEGKSTYSMSSAEKQEFVNKYKEVGNHYFKQNQASRALRLYKAAMDPVEYPDSGQDDEEKKVAKKLKAACLLNIAACHDKLEAWSEAVSTCNKALELADNPKARFRRAKAYTHLGRLEEAKDEFGKLLEQSPEDKAVQQLLATTRKRQKEQDAKAKSVFTKMFAQSG